MDVYVTDSLVIPAAELDWRFSRSSGPGGQHVNTSDSRVELSWNIATSTVLSAAQCLRLLNKFSARLVATSITVSASEQRSQLRNREIAAEKLAGLILNALAPDTPARRATQATHGSKRRHQAAKKRRSETKTLRRRPLLD